MSSADIALLAQTPALKPPPGVLPNFNTLYIDLQPLFIVIVSLYISLATFVVGARLIANLLDARLLQLEDCT